jgi:hypothetical protein
MVWLTKSKFLSLADALGAPVEGFKEMINQMQNQ